METIDDTADVGLHICRNRCGPEGGKAASWNEVLSALCTPITQLPPHFGTCYRSDDDGALNPA